jgi:VWFA-related protein
VKIPRFLLALSPLLAFAWQEAPPRFSVDVGAVALDVVVTDKKGRFVKNLKEEDFVVMEEGVQQELTFFTADTTPVTVLVLLDSSSSVRANLRPIQKAANRFIDKLSRGDKARIGFFHSQIIFGPQFTDNMKEHIAMINNMRPQRSTHLYDALLASFGELSKVQDRKSLVLFTDGDDEGSRATREDALEAAQRSFASIYTVGFMGWSFDEGMYINEDLLTQLATYTGGRAFYPQKEKELRKAFDSIRDELHRQYRMAYVPKEGAEEWREVQVKMTKRKNVVVRTRLGYYNRPEKKQ